MSVLSGDGLYLASAGTALWGQVTSSLLVLSSCSEPQQSTEQQPQQQAVSASAPPAANEAPAPWVGPESAKSPDWEFIVNNAKRTADEYATQRNPNAVFVGPSAQATMIKQIAGKHKGRYLLQIVHSDGGNISLAMLLPLFDENKPSDNLDDSGKLWEVVSAKYNGQTF